MGSEPQKIAVAGAGAVGCYVGGRLAAAGRDVTFLGRERLGSDIATHGLTVSDYLGQVATVHDVNFSTNPACLTDAELVLVAVKSTATREIATILQKYAPKAVVVSLQNGVSNPDILRAMMSLADVRGAVVPFNVVYQGQGRFHQATSGDLLVEDPGGDIARHLDVPGLPVQGSSDIRAAQWGKLLVNLNNALNALSGLTLLDQLQDRNWRRLLADQMQETLAVLRAAGITPGRFTSVPPAFVPHILRLPTPLFRRIARTMLTVDPEARLSMQHDLVAGRTTEIDALQGEVLKMAETLGMDCPTLRRATAAIKQAETAGNGPPNIDPRTL